MCVCVWVGGWVGVLSLSACASLKEKYEDVRATKP